MCRIESKALRDVESRWARRTAESSTERLVDALIKLARAVVTRRGGDGQKLSVTDEQRQKLRDGINAQAEFIHCE